MSCNLIYKNGKLEEVRADNGSPSILFQRAKQIFGEETAKEIFYVSKSDQFQEVFKATIEVYKQKLLNKFNNLNEVRFSILGEKGAQNLDQIEEATFRMDNLLVAKEMEQAGKTPQEIRLATGWEKGASEYLNMKDEDIINTLLQKGLITETEC